MNWKRKAKENLSGFHQMERKAKKKKKPTVLKDGSVPEKEIQRTILEWLRSTSLLHWRQNSGVVFAGHRMILLGEEGLPDIVCIVPPGGRMLGLEVKSSKGKLRPKQIEMAERIREAGGVYRVVRSLEQAKNVVAEVLGEATIASRKAKQ